MNKQVSAILQCGPLVLLCTSIAATATPIRLTVRPRGTNRVELIFGPVTPDVYYEVLARTNGSEGYWRSLAGYNSGSNKTITATCDLGGIPGLTLKTLNNWTFVAGRWDDPNGDMLPPLYKELALRIDPYASADPYGLIMGDGWSNIQKLQNDMNPFMWYQPPAPHPEIKFMQGGTNDQRHGTAILTWQVQYGPVPDYFLIERAVRTPRPMTNNPYWQQRPPGGLPGRTFTNRPPNFPQGFGRPGWQREDPFVTGPFQVVARSIGQPGVRDYRYVETNVDTLFQPLYRIQPHYSPPLHAHLDQVNTTSIRKTIISVTAQPTTNGYVLTVPHPIPYAWYLLLVRDKSDSQWRASGYFASGTNRNPVHLRVDKRGMMSGGQSPIAMPEVKFLPDVVEPEFVAGWGEDSDGDGLPDVYEVLVTHTEPDNADTGETGILDGYKEMTSDGWSNLEKFRRRVDPLRPAHPPPTVELKQPTAIEIMKAMTPTSGLSCEPEIEIRTNGAVRYQAIEQAPWMLSKILNYRQPNDRRTFDVRISWQFAEPKPRQYDGGALPAYEALEPLLERVNLQLFEAFKAKLDTNPPLSRSETSNAMAAIERVYRQGEMDKGIVMAELMTLQDNQLQDFYGKVVDQHGQPVPGANVTAQVNLSSARGSTQQTQTDANGLFQFTGLRGRSLYVTPEKPGFQIQGHGLGEKGANEPETSPTQRAAYTMWKLRGPEPMIHKELSCRTLQPDGRVYSVDFVKNQIAEGANTPADMTIQIQRPPEIKPREKFDWSFTMAANGGGFIEVTNDAYLNEAPESGYHQRYQMTRYATNVLNYSTWPIYRTDRTFYIKSRGGRVYGHFQIKELEPDYRGKAALRIESYINPAGSRNLEFDPAKQVR